MYFGRGEGVRTVNSLPAPREGEEGYPVHFGRGEAVRTEGEESYADTFFLSRNI